MSFNEDDIRKYVDSVEDFASYAAMSGLLTAAEANSIQATLQQALNILETPPAKTNQEDLKSNPSITQKQLDDAHALTTMAWYSFMGYVNSEPLTKRLLYEYGIQIWVPLIIFSVSLLFIILKGYVSIQFDGISGDVILWGGLGGCVYSLYNLRDELYGRHLTKERTAYWLIYPFAGMIFGAAIAFIVASGLLSVQAKPSYAVYASIAFLAGLFQKWVFSTLQDVAEAIHKTSETSQ